jgi:hypothetical protein
MHMDEQGKDWNEGHPDHEGEMAVSQLHRIAEMAQELLNIIGENDELQGWIQYKISRAFNDMNDAYNYIEAQSHMHGDDDFSEEEEEEIGEDYEEKDFDDYEEEGFDGYEDDEDDEEEDAIDDIEEGKKKGGKGLWHNIHARRRAGKRPKRPGEKGYPKTLDIGESLKLLKRLIAEEMGGRR